MGDCVRWADLSDDEMEFGDPTEVFGKLPAVPPSDTSLEDDEEERQERIREAQQQAQLVKKKKQSSSLSTPQRASANSIGSWRRKVPLVMSQPDLNRAVEEVRTPVKKKSQLTVTESHVFTSPVSADPTISDIAASLVNMQW